MSSSTFTGSSGLASSGSSVSSSTYSGSFSGSSSSSSFSSSTFTGSVSSGRRGTTSSSSSSSSSTSTSSSPSGGGGGGGGGSSGGGSSASGVFDYKEWLVDDSALDIKVNNTPYKIDVQDIQDIQATLFYKGNIYILALGENVFIDLSGDGSDDIKIKLMDIVPSVRILVGASLLHDARGTITGDGALNETVISVVSTELVGIQDSSSDMDGDIDDLNTEELAATNVDETLTLSLGDTLTDELSLDADLELNGLNATMLSSQARNGLLVLGVTAVLLCLFFFRHALSSLFARNKNR